jgi:phosphohistidine swiveling domain-containing protein
MNEFVVSLTKVRQSDVSRVGAKAAVLGTLREAGFPVLPGLCVTTAAFRRALELRWAEIAAILSKQDLRASANATSAAKAISELLADLRVPVPVSATLRETLPGITAQNGLLAVRSSATGEDGADVSFAGQYTSVLGARGAEAVEAAILAIWRSFFSPNALVARAAHGRLTDEVMAVLIQPMIAAECAGVCFSVDPVRWRRDLIVINAAWGLAAGVVDGSVATDTAWIRRDRFMVEEQRLAEKAEQISIGPNGGVQRVPVPERMQRAACLPESWLRRIGQFGVAAELYLGRPQDLEWAIADEYVWVLQSRPITELPRELNQIPRFPIQWENEQDRRRFWTLGELANPEGDTLLPLERDHQTQVERMREETCRFVGADKNGKLAFFNGRAYFCPLPLDLAQGDIRVRRAAMEDLKERLKRQGLTAWDYWGPEAVRATERLKAFDRDTADGSELAEHLEDALAVRRRHWMLHPMLWFKPRQSFFDAFESVSGLAGEAAVRAAYQLLDGEETPLTTLLDGLYALAGIARETPVVADLVSESPPDVLERLDTLPDGATLRAQLDAFLEVFGEHNGDGWGSEATLLTPTWSEQPVQVLRLAALYLDPSVESPQAARVRSQRVRDVKVEALCAGCTDEETVAQFRRELAYARKVMTVLEYHNHYLNQMSVGQLRHAVLAAANWLVAQGALAERDEVFWLHFDEISASLRAEAPQSLAPVVDVRRVEHEEWIELEPPPILGVPDARLPGRPALQDEVALAESQAAGHITGLGASPGRYRGRARVVAATVTLPDLSPGDVLVAENAGPRWTPIFPILGALVLDSGSIGQHAAAAAREYGVPAVIETQNATRRISDGVWVTVDGTNGTVALELNSAKGVSQG